LIDLIGTEKAKDLMPLFPRIGNNDWWNSPISNYTFSNFKLLHLCQGCVWLHC